MSLTNKEAHEYWMDAADELGDENRRLRAALTEISQLTLRLHPVAGYQFDRNPCEIARAALADAREEVA